MSARTWWIWATRCRLGHDWVNTYVNIEQCMRCYKVRKYHLYRIHGRPHDQRMKDDHEGFDQ